MPHLQKPLLPGPDCHEIILKGILRIGVITDGVYTYWCKHCDGRRTSKLRRLHGPPPSTRSGASHEEGREQQD